LVQERHPVLENGSTACDVRHELDNTRMAFTDDALLDFDSNGYAAYEAQTARETLAGEHGDVYHAQLVAACWIDGWRQRTAEYDEQNPTETHPERWTQGWERRYVKSSRTCATAT
jgi:hypothetical protein